MEYRSFRHKGIVLLFALALFGCRSTPQEAAAGGGGRGASSGNRGVAVETAKMQRISLERAVDVSGTLMSPDQAKVSSEVAGKVNDVLIEIGHEVSVGQPLVQLDT